MLFCLVLSQICKDSNILLCLQTQRSACSKCILDHGMNFMGLFTRTWMCNIFFFQNLHSIIIHRVSMLLEVKLATRHFDSLGGVNVISSSMRKQSLLLSVFRIYHLSPTTSWYTMVKKSFSRVLFKRFSVLP